MKKRLENNWNWRLPSLDDGVINALEKYGESKEVQLITYKPSKAILEKYKSRLNEFKKKLF